MRLKEKWTGTLTAIFFIFVFPLIPSRAADVNDVIQKLQKNYEKITTISAAFAQKTFSKAMNRTGETGGRVYFKKPGMMRWNYLKGSKDELVSNGTTMWLYQADLGQVIEREAKDQPDIARDFLTGVGNLERDFDVKLAKEGDETYRLELVPKKFQPGIKKLSIDVDKKRFLVVRTVVHDPFGNVTTVSLEDIELNPPLEDSLFEFSAPEGVKVIRP